MDSLAVALDKVVLGQTIDHIHMFKGRKLLLTILAITKTFKL